MGAAFVVPVCMYVTVPFELSLMKSVGCAVLKMKSLLSLHQLSIIAGAMLAVLLWDFPVITISVIETAVHLTNTPVHFAMLTGLY